MSYDAFDLYRMGRPISGQVRLRELQYHGYELDDLGLLDLERLGYGYNYLLHRDYTTREYSLWYQGKPVFDLRPAKNSQIGLGKDEKMPGCDVCGNAGVFIRTALFCPVHKTLIGGF